MIIREQMKDSSTIKVEVVSRDLTPPSLTPRIRRPYAKPVLEVLGDIRDLTMGVSMGMNESGMGSTFKN